MSSYWLDVVYAMNVFLGVNLNWHILELLLFHDDCVCDTYEIMVIEVGMLGEKDYCWDTKVL